VTQTPAQFKAFIAKEAAEGTELLKDAGFKPE
jgi:tripartite-type tricarboxylate transporter receptor subunit TctC